MFTDGLGELLNSAGFTNEMKLELFVMEKHQIMMRVENIADVYNSDNIV